MAIFLFRQWHLPGIPGQTATFSATVLGSPAPTLQWYSNSVANPAYVAIPNATNSTLSLPGITTAQSGSLFYLQAVNIYGSSTNTPCRFDGQQSIHFQ